MSPLLSACQLSKSYGTQHLFNQVTFGIGANEKIGLVGLNGTGKTTLLKILAGILIPTQGELLVAPTTSIAYLSQHAEHLDNHATVLEEYQRSCSSGLPTLRKELAKCGLFGDDRVYMRVAFYRAHSNWCVDTCKFKSL